MSSLSGSIWQIGLKTQLPEKDLNIIYKANSSIFLHISHSFIVYFVSWPIIFVFVAGNKIYLESKDGQAIINFFFL